MGRVIICPVCNGSGIVRMFELTPAVVEWSSVMDTERSSETVPAPSVTEARCTACGGSGAADPRRARTILVGSLASALADELDGLDIDDARRALDKLEAWGWLR